MKPFTPTDARRFHHLAVKHALNTATIAEIAELDALQRRRNPPSRKEVRWRKEQSRLTQAVIDTCKAMLQKQGKRERAAATKAMADYRVFHEKGMT
jgi:hypothetical protein